MVLKKEKESAKKVSKTTKDKADKSVVPKSAKSKTITKSKAEYIPKEGRMARRFNKLRIKGDENSKRGVVYIGHLTKGFNEEELKKFFGQFGTVSKLRVARSKTSGRSKGYAFLQFTDKDVAEIAVKTMDKYLMFGKQIDCHMVETPHRETFKNGNREWKYVPTKVIFKKKYNNDEKTDAQRAARVEGLLQKEKERRIRFKELNIEYDFTGFQGIIDEAKPSGTKSNKKVKVESPKTSRKSSLVEEKVAEKPAKREHKDDKKSSKSAKKSKK